MNREFFYAHEILAWYFSAHLGESKHVKIVKSETGGTLYKKNFTGTHVSGDTADHMPDDEFVTQGFNFHYPTFELPTPGSKLLTPAEAKEAGQCFYLNNFHVFYSSKEFWNHFHEYTGLLKHLF